MNGHSLSSYGDQLAAFRQSDTERDALVEVVIKKFEDLQLEYSRKCDDYSNEVESRRMWQAKATQTEQALAEHKQASGSNSFVLAIIDGDGAIFQDSLLAQGKDGGSAAAHQLHSEITNRLKITYPDANVDDWNIVVQVILNLQGLAAKLQSCGVITTQSDLFAFGRAFGLAHPLFNFIDVGSGKERADHKIRETLRVFLPNVQCKHVFFGPCHDNGYLVVLERYRHESKKITLLETRPAEPGFLDLNFEMFRYPRIFRTDDLSGKPVSSVTVGGIPSTAAIPARTSPGLQASSQPMRPKISSAAPSPDSVVSSSWATVGKSGPTGQVVNIATNKKTLSRRFILLNVDDERLDVELPRPDQMAEKRYANRSRLYGNCCNNYHITGRCPNGDNCSWTHGERLAAPEQLVLKHKARSNMCPQVYMCRDIDCILGHHCKYGDRCYPPNCTFASTHGMDTTPAKRYYEDGSEAWVKAYLEKLQNV